MGSQVLVTHHVELVLPGAYYLVRMLDGRIDTQGVIKDLRTLGILENITQEASVEVYKKAATVVPPITEEQKEKGKNPKSPRKLVQDEHRETGSVKWSVYTSYLKASYVDFPLDGNYQLTMTFRSYWIWAFLVFLVLINQLLGVAEKLWIKVLDYPFHLDNHFNCWNRSGGKHTNLRYPRMHLAHSYHLITRP